MPKNPISKAIIAAKEHAFVWIDNCLSDQRSLINAKEDIGTGRVLTSSSIAYDTYIKWYICMRYTCM